MNKKFLTKKMETLIGKIFDLFMIILVAYFALNTIMIKFMIVLLQAENKEMCVTTSGNIFSPIVFCTDK